MTWRVLVAAVTGFIGGRLANTLVASGTRCGASPAIAPGAGLARSRPADSKCANGMCCVRGRAREEGIERVICLCLGGLGAPRTPGTCAAGTRPSCSCASTARR